MPTPTHAFQHTSIDDAIDDLKGVDDETIPNQSQYFVATKATKGAGQGDHSAFMMLTSMLGKPAAS